MGCATALIVLLAAVMLMTRGVAGAADQFVGHVSKGELDEAYALCGGQLTEELNREQFESFLRSSRLVDLESASWTHREIKNEAGEMGGKVKLKGGDELPVTFFLRKIEGDWKIAGINLKGGAPSQELDLPDEPTALALVQQGLDGLGAYIQTQDKGPLLEACGHALGEKLGQEGVLDGFLSNFPDQQMLLKLFKEELKLSQAPKRNEAGTLLIQGQSVPTDEGHYLAFEFTYLAESKQWKLTDINLHTRKAE